MTTCQTDIAVTSSRVAVRGDVHGLIMEVQMPVMDGLAASLNAGMDQFLGKPFQEGELIDSIERCTTQRGISAS